jgi:hypothetical protein
LVEAVVRYMGKPLEAPYGVVVVAAQLALGHREHLKLVVPVALLEIRMERRVLLPVAAAADVLLAHLVLVERE